MTRSANGTKGSTDAPPEGRTDTAIGALLSGLAATNSDGTPTSAAERAAESKTNAISSWRLAYSIDEAARLISCGRTTIYALARAGELPISRIGKRKSVVLAVHLLAYVNRLREGGRS